MLRIELVKSPIGNNIRNRRTVTALGLRKVHQVVEQPDNPSIRGMIHHVKHLLKWEVVEGEVKEKTPAKPVKAEAKTVKEKVQDKGKGKAKETPASAAGPASPTDSTNESPAEDKPKATRKKAEAKS